MPAEFEFVSSFSRESKINLPQTTRGSFLSLPTKISGEHKKLRFSVRVSAVLLVSPASQLTRSRPAFSSLETISTADQRFERSLRRDCPHLKKLYLVTFDFVGFFFNNSFHFFRELTKFPLVKKTIDSISISIL